jgi:hypothetical protein
VFWSILGSIGLFIRFAIRFSKHFENTFENYILYTKMFEPLVRFGDKELTFETESEEDFFHMITSLSQGNKMKALRMLKERSLSLRE